MLKATMGRATVLRRPPRPASSETMTMTFEAIQELHVENYGCIKKASFQLTPLHALIGPNDSGKSTVLRALQRISTVGLKALEFGDTRTTTDEGGPTKISLGYAQGLRYGASWTRTGVVESLQFGGSQELHVDRLANQPSLFMNGDLSLPPKAKADVQRLRSSVRPAMLVRLDPDELRMPAPLIPETEGVGFENERGRGLASVFDAITNRDAETFAAIQARVRELFPNVAKLGLSNTSTHLKELAVTLTDGTRVGAHGLSEGLLYFLAFAALQHVSNAGLFLVEEPENGLHPSRIAEIMKVLREMSKTHQIVIATHSPLVINELEPHEVSVVTRDATLGTQVKLIKDTPDFEARHEVYALGELWLSYADGSQESALLNGGTRP
jgi:predicted ATPase